MAEIKIKKKTPIWPWILLIVVIVALLYFLFFVDDNDTVDMREDNTEVIMDNNVDDEAVGFTNNETAGLKENANSKIEIYSEYIADGKMGIDHVYSNGALEKLINATETTANALDVDISADLEIARDNATSITKDPYKVDHANKIKNAGTIIVNALGKIQEQKFPDMGDQISELRNSLMAIEPQIKTLNQKSEVKMFFEQASNILTNMVNI